MKLTYILLLALGFLSLPNYLGAQQTEGAQDSSFVLRINGGSKITDNGFDHLQAGLAFAIVELEDGKLGVGYSNAISVFNADGTREAGFPNPKLSNLFSGNVELVGFHLTANQKFVITGNTTNQYAHKDFFAARFNRNGTLDSSFGDDGYVFIDKDGLNQKANSATVAADGSIYIAGNQYVGGDFSTVVVKLTPDGVLDTSFGTSGILINNLSTKGESPSKIISVADGIVIGGFYVPEANNNTLLYITKFSHTGVLNTEFGTAGLISFTFETGDDKITDMKELPGGSFITSIRTSNTNIRAAKFSAAGVLDASFGTSGYLTFPVGGSNITTIKLFLTQEKDVVMAGTKYLTASTIVQYMAKFDTTGVKDPSFGTDGMQDFSYSNTTELFVDLLETQNNTFTLVGFIYTSQGAQYLSFSRLSKTGLRDYTYYTTYTYGSNSVDFNEGADVGKIVRVKDNKIYVAAQTSKTGSTVDFLLSRFTMDGEIDSTFNGTGKVAVDLSVAGASVLVGMDFLANGKIILGGSKVVSGLRKAIIVRLNADGSLDTTFGGGTGYLTHDIASTNYAGSNYISLMQVFDNKIYLAGGFRNNNGYFYWQITRINSNGLLDGTFGGGGRFTYTTSQDFSDVVTSLLVQPDKKVLISGRISKKAFMMRLSPEGVLDQTFATSTNGRLHVTFPDAGVTDTEFSKMIILPDYKILVAGKLMTGGSGKVFLAKITSDGKFDLQYGTAGVARSLNIYSTNSIDAIQLLSDESVLYVGSSGADSGDNILLARFTPNGELDMTFGVSGRVDRRIRNTYSHPHGATIQEDGNVLVTGEINLETKDVFLTRLIHSKVKSTEGFKTLIKKQVDVTRQEDLSEEVSGEVYPGELTIDNATLWYGTDYENLSESVVSETSLNNETGFEWKTFSAKIPQIADTNLVTHVKWVVSFTNGTEMEASSYIYNNKTLPKARLVAWYTPINNVLKSANGGIRTVLDLSDKKNNLLVESENSAPVFKPNGINTHPSFAFDGTERFFTTENDVNLTTYGTTVFVVGKNNSRKNSNGILRIAPNRTDVASSFEIYWEQGTVDTGSGTLVFTANRNTTGNPLGRGVKFYDAGSAVGEPYMITVNANSIMSQYSFINGAQANFSEVTGTNQTGRFIPQGIHKGVIGLGKNQNLENSEFLDGEIAEMIIYDTVLDPAQRDSVHAYLHEKYFVEVVANESVQPLENLKFELTQNYPNPFNPSTQISYQLAKESFVSLNVFDVMGRKVQTLVQKQQNSGKYSVQFDASKLSSGIYFYQISTNTGFSQSRKMMLIK